ncbi:MAG: hypothetical protein JXB25_12360 [Deltaproteobacteria bacterium]|nr:hypothetical protein [Deltaproteobacteria bacterium]
MLSRASFRTASRLVSGCDLLLMLGFFLPYENVAPTLIVNRCEVMLPGPAHRFFVKQEHDSYFREVATCLTKGGG